MNENLQAVLAAAHTLRWSGEMAFGHVGRAPSPSTADASVDTDGITLATGLLPFCS